VADSDTGAEAEALIGDVSALDGAPPAKEPPKHDVEAMSRRPSDRDLAGVLHEVSNALTVVLGWIDRARGELDAMPTVEDALAIAASRARHARGIVRRAIGADVPDESPTSVPALVREAATGCDPEAQRAGVELRMSIEPGVESAYLMGRSAILQILTNLLLNAVAVSPPGATIELEAAIDGPDDIVFGVTDEGPGVPVERRANLLDAGVSTRAGGAGIGLRYAGALARESGGVLSLVHAEPHARFELRWPRRASVPPSPRSSRKPALVLAGKRILVVEDDAAVFDLLEAALDARGATIVCARDPGELSRALEMGSFDAALCDLSPIRDDVAGALARIRETSPSARLILVSGNTTEPLGLASEWIAAQIRKPFEIAEIIAALTA
jgi:CheY-like chemotaxis protein